MTASKRQSLSLDLDALFPGKDITFGQTTIVIRPLSIQQIALLSKQINGIGANLADMNVGWDNYNEPHSLAKIASVILENFPNVLEEASNIAIEDLQILPIEAIVQIVETIIDVNLKSKEALEKNFKSLTKKFVQESKPATKTPKKIRKK